MAMPSSRASSITGAPYCCDMKVAADDTTAHASTPGKRLRPRVSGAAREIVVMSCTPFRRSAGNDA